MKKFWSYAVIVLVVLFGFSMSTPLTQAEWKDGAPSGKAKELPNGILVKFKEKIKANKEAKKAVHESMGAEFVSEIPHINVHLVKGKNGQAAEALLKAYANHKDVEYVELNGLFHTTLTPDDPGLPKLYGLHNTGQTGGTADADIDALEAWDRQTGSANVIVADIDTGVAYNHPDLAANMWTNPGEIANNDIDDDNNGYIDDYYGWDFANNDNDPMDDNGHGTHTSGTIAAVGNNGVGVAGVSWQAKIMAIKFLNSRGSGSFEAGAQSIIYAADNGAQISSNSWGCGPNAGCFSQVVEDAIAYAATKGMLFVVAAGNSNNNNDVTIFYPCTASPANVLCVAATDHNDNRASFSDYGATTVDLGAPGVATFSTFPPGAYLTSTCNDASDGVPNDGYGHCSGTSMATPHVSGAAALVLAEFPDLTYAEIKGLLMDSVDPVPSMNGITVTGGRLNVNNALGINFTVSADPANRTLLIGDSSTVIISVNSLNSFNFPVTLSVDSPDPGITGTFSVNPVTPPADGSIQSVLTIATTAATPRGTYVMTVTGTDDLGETHAATITIQMVGPDYTLSVSPSEQGTGQAGSATYTVTLTSIDGYNSSVTLGMTAPSAEITGSFDPAVLALPADGTATSTLTVTASSTAPFGSYTLTVEGTDGVKDRSGAATLIVTGTDLVVSALSNPPATVGTERSFGVTDTTLNRGSEAAAASTTKFYLSPDTAFSSGDILLPGVHAVPALTAGASSTATTTVTVPTTVAAANYFLVACADAAGAIHESNNGNNCAASTEKVTVLAVGHFNGYVFKSDGTRLPGATVEIRQGSDVKRTATTNSSGYWTATNLVVESYDITVSAGGYTPEITSGTTRANAYTRVDVTLLLTTEGSISGVVYRPDGTTPQASASVQALQNGTVIRSTTTAADGTYRFGMPAGTYDVKAAYGTYYGPGLATGLAVTEGGAATANVTLAEGGAFYGYLFKSDGSRLPGATVVVSQGGIVKGSTTATSYGYWRITNMPLGTYDVTASADGYVSETRSGTIRANAYTRMDMTLLLTTEGSISGVVYRPGGTTPQANASVQALQNGTVIRSTTTAADGTYRFGMDPGTYDVKAGYGYLYSPGLVEGVVVTAGGAATANVTMNDGGVFYGYLFKSDGTRLASATVEISQGTDVKRTATTNSSGYWRINNVAVGTYDVKASATGYVSETKSGTINANAYTRVDGTLLLGTEGSISGVVYRPDGTTPQANAWVQALQDGTIIRSTTTAADGTYRFGMPQGTYDVKAGYGTYYSPGLVTGVVVPEGGAATANVSLAEGGAFNGYLFKSDGTRLPGATVEISQGGIIKRSTTTSSSGYWRITNMPLGTYDVTASANGYVSGTKSGTINANRYTRVDITLLLNEEGSITGVVYRPDGTTPQANAWVQAISQFGLWNDDFETGDLLAGEWTSLNNRTGVTGSAFHTGIYGAKIRQTTWIEKAFSTEGYSHIKIGYSRQTKRLDADEHLSVEWYDGINWHTLETVQNASYEDGAQLKLCGVGADNNADFRIRFRINADSNKKSAYIDDVTITAGEVIRTTTAASDGTYRFGMPAGTYDVKAGYGTYYSPGLVTDVVAPEGGETTANVTLTEGGAFNGYLFKSDGSRLPGATVEISQGGIVKGSTTATSYGYWRITNMPLGTYDVTASADGYVSQTKSGTITANRYTRVDITLLLVTEGSITGVVYRPDGTTPQANASVQALQNGTVIRSTTTAADGTYRFGMPPGTYNVKAVYGYLYDPGLVTGIVVTEGGARTADVTLAEGGVFYGYLFKSDWSRLSGAAVEISQGGIVKGSTTTNSSGYWRINNMPVGVYDVTASADGYVSQTKSGTINASAYTRVDVTLLLTTEGSITGVVYRPDGATPQASASVQALQNGTVIRSATTAADGTYRFGMPPGTYDVKAVYGAYYGPGLAAGVVVPEGGAAAANVSLADGGAFNGYLFKSDGTRLSGAAVEISQGGIVKGSTTTNSSGYWRITNMPVGVYDVTASADGYVSQTKSGTISANRYTRVDITLLLTTEGSIGGVVYRPDGTTPQASASVQALQNGTVIRSTTTAADGTYRFGMPPGTYDVKATYGTYYSPGLAAGVVVPEGGAATANVTLADGGAFNGYLFKSDGTRLSGATMEISQGGIVKGSATTNSSGYWRITNMPLGTYDVTASADGYVSQTKSGTIRANAYTRVDITVLLVTEGSITGVVYRPDGTTPQANASVQALQNGTVIRSTTTAADGTYRFGMPPGTYDVKAVYGTYNSPGLVTGVAVTGGGAATANVTLAEGGAFYGYLFKSDLSRLPGATVEISQGGIVKGSATTNSSGYWRINNVPVGVYDVKASATGYVSQTKSGTINANAYSRLDFTLVVVTAGVMGNEVYQLDGVTLLALQEGPVIRNRAAALFAETENA